MGDFLNRVGQLLDKGRIEDSGAGVLGVSRAMRTVETLLRRVAPIDSVVLLTGESGVGKEVAAHFLHNMSPRAPEPFVAVNCAAVPGDLLESEMFGHERGSFTGAHARHEGYAERAKGGTLFLDEISEMPLPLQAKLLRLVQDQAFFRIGGEEAVPFGARLVCATNADLRARVDEGRFRKDLFYRLDVIHVPIPPLRERRDDIVPLIDHYVTRFTGAFGREVRGLTTLAHDAVLSYDWPGNVRELRNRVERAVALSDGSWLSERGLFPERESAFSDGRAEHPAEVMSLAAARAEAERRCIRAALREANGKAPAAAMLLGISRSTLFEKMRRLGLGDGDAGEE
ncbi:MAG: sigma-54-dependent Fis family transcriptional regulator, partial [Alphaproteobacteria bacterium]|nr:sigma-54-dependent Fis family transcriptional regulator [Alphaproteobacteria bacterium]